MEISFYLKVYYHAIPDIIVLYDGLPIFHIDAEAFELEYPSFEKHDYTKLDLCNIESDSPAEIWSTEFLRSIADNFFSALGILSPTGIDNFICAFTCGSFKAAEEIMTKNNEAPLSRIGEFKADQSIFISNSINLRKGKNVS